MDQDARLDGIDVRSVDGRRRARHRPCLAAVVRDFEMHAPPARALRRFGAASSDDDVIGHSNRLVLDWAENALGQPAGAGPGHAAVAGCADHAPPSLWRWAHLVEERERAIW